MTYIIEKLLRFFNNDDRPAPLGKLKKVHMSDKSARNLFIIGSLVGVGIFVVDYFKLGKEPLPVGRAVPEKA